MGKEETILALARWHFYLKNIHEKMIWCFLLAVLSYLLLL